MEIAAVAIELLSLLNLALKAGLDISITLDKLSKVLGLAHTEKRDLTPDERTIYDAEIDMLRKILHS